MKCLPSPMLYFGTMVETAVTVRKSQHELVQTVTVTTGLLGLAHSGRIESLPCTHLKHTYRQCEKFCGLFLGIRAWKRLGVCCPQNVKFSKSITARVCSAILTWNNGPWDAERKIGLIRLGLAKFRLCSVTV